jgi:hypothetical protein
LPSVSERDAERAADTAERAKFFKFSRDRETNVRTLSIETGEKKGTIMHGRSAPPPEELGTIERINTKNASIFLCIGSGSAATYASVRYLTEHWKKIAMEAGSGEFAISLRLRGQLPDDATVM